MDLTKKKTGGKTVLSPFIFSIPLSLPPVMSDLTNEKAPARLKNAPTEQIVEELADVLDDDDQEINPAMEMIFEEKDLVDRLKNLPIWLLSLAIHIAIMVALAMHYLGDKNQNQVEIISQPGEEVGVDMDELGADELEIADFAVETFEEQPVPVDQPATVTDFQQVTEVPLTETFDFSPNASTELIEPVSAVATGGLAGRMEGKGMLLKSGGGNAESEKAVERALDWLARHQQQNGSWTFKLGESGSCGCSSAGSIDATNAATAMGLLPFLGAGHTPTKGKYRKTVARGIDFLLQNGIRTPNGYDMRDPGGRMYAHGLASIVFCEACAMADKSDKEHYKTLLRAAQEAISFVEYAQDPSEGGWRYSPQERGDTSVVGWQLMALKSADFGGLSVHSIVPRKALNFLMNQVSYDNQSRYGYQGANGGTLATTSIGLLCRLFLDWKTDNPSLLMGINFLSDKGPDFGNPYYIYYATQLMHHVGGPTWKEWNNQVRDQLVNSQVKEGEMAGSWFPSNGDSHCKTAGRLYATSLFCMTLEVYYRHMPLYQLQQQNTEEELFPID